MHVGGDGGGAFQVGGHQSPVPQRRQIGGDQRHGQEQDATAGPAGANGEGGDPGAEQQAQAQQDERDDPVGRPQRQFGGGVGPGGLDQPPEGRGVLEGIGAHGQDHAAQDQGDGEGPVAPPDHHSGRHADDGDQKAHHDQPRPLEVPGRGRGPGTQLVLAVEVPVAQAPQHLRREGGGRDGGYRLGVLEDVQPVGPLGPEPGHPPHRHAQAEDPEAHHGPQGRPESGLVGPPDGVDHPEQGGQPHQQDRGGVHPAHQGDDHGEQRRIPPAPLPHGQDGQGHHPPECGPRHHDARDARDVVEDVRGEHVRQRPGQPPGPGQPEQSSEVPDPGAGGEEERPHPESLADPDRDVQLGHQPVVGPHGEQEADVLVGHRPGSEIGVPRRDGALDQAARVEVEVLLGVGGDLARLSEERGDVADGRQEQPHRQVDGLGPPAAPGGYVGGRAGRDGRNDGGGFAHGSAGSAG